MDRYQIIDRMGCKVATAQSLHDAAFAYRKYNAKHIYDTVIQRTVKAELFQYSDGEFKIVTENFTDFYSANGVCTAHLANKLESIGDSDL